MEQDTERFIVAEISKNWTGGRPDSAGPTLGQHFEACLNTNLARGYRLVDWRLDRLSTGSASMNETIVAVFERCDQEG